MEPAANLIGDRSAQYIRRTRAAVERLLEHNSFTSLSVEDIIQEAGIARSTFYVYFADKGQMLGALTADLLDDALVAVRAWWELPPTADFAELRDALAGFIHFFHRHSALLKAVIDASAYDPDAAAGFAHMVRSGEEGIAEHIRTGQQEHSVAGDIDPDVVARWLVRLVEQGLYELIPGADEAQRERLIDAISMISWNILYRGARQR
jgi:AcrR family transcriptional regulator